MQKKAKDGISFVRHNKKIIQTGKKSFLVVKQSICLEIMADSEAKNKTKQRTESSECPLENEVISSFGAVFHTMELVNYFGQKKV